MRAGWVVVGVLATANAAQADLKPAETEAPSGFAGPFRFSINVGFPDELVGVGVGRTFLDGDWRVEATVGTMVFAVSGALRVQRALFRSGIVVVGVGVQAGAAYAKDIFCCGDPKSNRTLGARVVVELGRARGWGFVAEAGADGYLGDEGYGATWGDDTIFDAYASFVPAFSLRAAYSWGR